MAAFHLPERAARSARKQARRFVPTLFQCEDRLVPATYNVNTLLDPQFTPDFKLPDQPGATTVSLRSAIQQINVGTVDNSFTDTINLPAGLLQIQLPQDPGFVPSGSTPATVFHDNTSGAFTINPKT